MVARSSACMCSCTPPPAHTCTNIFIIRQPNLSRRIRATCIKLDAWLNPCSICTAHGACMRQALHHAANVCGEYLAIACRALHTIWQVGGTGQPCTLALKIALSGQEFNHASSLGASSLCSRNARLVGTHARVPAVEGAVAALCQTEPDLLKHHPVRWSIWCRAAAQSDVAVEPKSVRFR